MDREQALETVLGQIERQFGKGAVMKMNGQAQVAIAAVSTGSLSLDIALGVGGLPRGRVVEVFGPESSGKTTLVYHVIAEAQRRGGICAFIDAEHAMDPAYAKRIGVDIDNLLVSQPDTGEQALEITELLIRSGALDVLAIDSVAALTPKAEIEGEMGDSHVGLPARRRSSRRSSTSSTAPASPGKARSSTRGSTGRSSRSRARTSASATSGSARVVRTRPPSCASTPT